jgi:uncharacterized SAM-binding protein YcdF (DUF218 family)
MHPAEWRPILSSLVLPPTGPLLLVALGCLLLPWRRAIGRATVLLGLLLLWAMCSNAVAVQLAHWLLPPVAALPPLEAVERLRAERVQAIVVLGGGLYPSAPEAQGPQPARYTEGRALYGGWLARESGLPLAFAGGIGWAQLGQSAPPTEAEAVAGLLARTGLPALRWADDRSRDTRENAHNMAALLHKDGIERIALVTNAWHLPRGQRAFEAAGLWVLPAPMGFVAPYQRPLLEWLPSSHGLSNTHNVLREWLALRMGR